MDAFCPTGATVLVGTTPAQVTTSDNAGNTSYRVRNPTAAAAYISWVAPLPLNATPAIGTVAAPTAGAPAVNTIGIGAGGVEILYFGVNFWFKASAGATFEVTPGQGI